MSVEADTADIVVHEGVVITEAAAKLVALGAKNLAALVIALATNSNNLTGKTNLMNLVKEGSEPLIFSMNKRDLKAFSKESQKYGFLFSTIKTKDGNTLEVIARRNDVVKINNALRNIGYGDLSREEQEKNGMTRAQSMTVSSERGSGLGLQEAQTTMSNEVIAPDALISTAAKQVRIHMPTDNQKGLEALGSANLALIFSAMINKDIPLLDREKLNAFLIGLEANNREPVTFTINSHDLKAFSKEAEENRFSFSSIPGISGKDTQILANASDITAIRKSLSRLGYAEIGRHHREAPQVKTKGDKVSPAPVKTSVVASIESAKKRLKEEHSGKSKQQEKEAPVRA